LIALALSVSWAQQQAELQNESDLQECLDTPRCGELFTTLLSETMLEMGLLFQHESLGGSALVGKGNGVVAELSFQSTAIGPKNVVQDQIPLPPIVPRLEVGYQVGSFTYDDPYPQYAVSAFVLPPIGIGDFKTFSAGLSGSFAFPLGTHLLWAGAEADLSYGSVAGPFVGDGDVIDDIDVVGSLIDVESPACESTAQGCQDRFRSVAMVPKIGLSFEPHPVLFGYGKLGLGWINSGIRVDYDRSEWRLRGLQPQLSYGGGARLGDRVQISFGAVTVLRDSSLSSDGSTAVTRFVGSFSIHTGDERYWSTEDQPGDRPSP